MNTDYEPIRPYKGPKTFMNGPPGVQRVNSETRPPLEAEQFRRKVQFALRPNADAWDRWVALEACEAFRPRVIL